MIERLIETPKENQEDEASKIRLFDKYINSHEKSSIDIENCVFSDIKTSTEKTKYRVKFKSFDRDRGYVYAFLQFKKEIRFLGIRFYIWLYVPTDMTTHKSFSVIIEDKHRTRGYWMMPIYKNRHYCMHYVIHKHDFHNPSEDAFDLTKDRLIALFKERIINQYPNIEDYFAKYRKKASQRNKIEID